MMRWTARFVQWATPSRGRWYTPLLLLIPAIVLMGAIYLAGLLIFSRYSFYDFSGGSLAPAWQWDAYRKFLTDPYYYGIIGNTFSLALKVTGFCLLLAYPLAYTIARLRSKTLKQLLILISFLPLLISAVVRSYGWMIVLSRQGFLNWLLIRLGLSEEGLSLAYTETGVVIALVHIFLPFMVLPILSVLVQQEPVLKLAAHDLGAGKLRAFATVTFPLSAKGIASGVQIVFTLCLTAFTTPQLIGGGRVMTLPVFIYQRTLDTNWPMAAVASVVLLVSAVVVSLLVNRAADRLSFRRSGKAGVLR